MPEAPQTETQLTSRLRVTASLIAKLNLADHQNSVPALRELAVANDTDACQERLIVSASSEPAFFKPKHWHIDAIGPGQSCQLSRLDLPLDGPLLNRLTESELARVRFEVRHMELGTAALATSEHDVELLPRNQWGGVSHLPEMIAAFVQPNDAAVERLLKKAAQLLRENGKNPALSGYQFGPKHAWEILSAIWSAVASEKLDYTLPPASFERTGQKVRSPAQILESGLGTCLDLTLLFAAAAEQAGLNSLVIFAEGHAFAGCWLHPDQFPTTVTDDPAALRKRLRLEELVLFETTVVTEHPAPAFSRANELGAQQLGEGDDGKFECAVDIRRARMQKIQPLASESAPDRLAAAIEADSSTIALEDAPNLPDAVPESPVEPDPRTLTPADRIARWQRKLLDLSLRNSLLNFRKGKRALVLEAPDPGKLEDALASGQPLRILPLPALMNGVDPRSRAIHEARAHEDIRKQHALEGLSKQEVFVAAGTDELEATLVELYRSARLSLEEGGANTLFLALGFLVWTQEGKAPEVFHADRRKRRVRHNAIEGFASPL